MNSHPMPALSTLSTAQIRVLSAMDIHTTTRRGADGAATDMQFTLTYCATPATPARTRPTLLVTLNLAAGTCAAQLRTRDAHGATHDAPLTDTAQVRALVDAVLDAGGITLLPAPCADARPLHVTRA